MVSNQSTDTFQDSFSYYLIWKYLIFNLQIVAKIGKATCDKSGRCGWNVDSFVNN